MRKLFVFAATFCLAVILPLQQLQTVRAYSGECITGKEADDAVVDFNCQRKIIDGSAVDPYTHQPICNDYCSRTIIYDGPDYITPNNQYCVYGSNCKMATDTSGNPSILADMNIPLDPPQADVILIYIRGGIMAIMGITSLALILYGLYGWYLRAMSEGNPEKVELSLKIYKDAIIGAIIVFMAVVITQMVFLLVGITDSPFDFNFIPKAGYRVNVKPNDVGRLCYANQRDSTPENGTYICLDNRWAAQ